MRLSTAMNSIRFVLLVFHLIASSVVLFDVRITPSTMEIAVYRSVSNVSIARPGPTRFGFGDGFLDQTKRGKKRRAHRRALLR